MNGLERENMSARLIGLELVQLASDLSRQAAESFETEQFDLEARLPIPETERSSVHSDGEALVRKLFSVLSEDGWKPDHLAEEVAAGKTWSFGRVTETAALRQIRNGFLEPRRILPLVSNVPDIVVHFLITLPGGKDFLDREHHGPVGWHYHYLDMKKRRSDVILCWDTRWPGAVAPSRPAVRPIFQEKHSEGTAHFRARPRRWSDDKCESMHQACEPDLRRPISEFRCAANKARAVWPLDSILTPRI